MNKHIAIIVSDDRTGKRFFGDWPLESTLIVPAERGTYDGPYSALIDSTTLSRWTVIFAQVPKPYCAPIYRSAVGFRGFMGVQLGG